MNIKIINRSPFHCPAYETTGASGMDVRAVLTEPIYLPALQRVRVPTGLYVEIPIGYEMQVRPRSGLAAKKGLTVLNAPGTIDADYRGEIQVLLINLSDQQVVIEHGERIAQLVVAPVVQISWQTVEVLSPSARDAGGFGSTGQH